MKKTAIIILSVLVICALAFGGFVYYMNIPNLLVAKAFSNGAGTSAYNGSMELKINFDTSKLLTRPELAGNPMALAQIQVIKDTLENSTIGLVFNGISGKNESIIDGEYMLPQAIGPSSSFKLYSDGNGTWFKVADDPWSKVENNGPKVDITPEDEEASRQAALDFLKSCNALSNGDKITITMNPTYEDIKKLIPKKILDEINNASQGEVNLEKTINALKIQATLTINKNSNFFIPNPSISKIDMEIKGDMSKLLPDVTGIPEEEKVLFEGISFTAKGAVNIEKSDNIKLEKPEGI